MKLDPAIPSIDSRVLLDGELMQIAHVAVRPASSDPGPVETSASHVLALPLAGLFARHDGPRHRDIATPNHALFISAGRPYRLSFPGCIGDRCLVLRFSAESLAHLAPHAMDGQGFDAAQLVPNVSLPASVMLARSLLWRRLAQGSVDALDAQEQGAQLLDAALRAARKHGSARAQSVVGGGERRLRQVDRTVEAIWARPGHKWTLDELASGVHVSPSHLSHIFRAEVGLSVYDCVVRARLGQALQAVLDSNAEFTEIGLDAGFASHSHFTSRFRALFGCTPKQVRTGLNRASAGHLRRIVTAPQALGA